MQMCCYNSNKDNGIANVDNWIDRVDCLERENHNYNVLMM